MKLKVFNTTNVKAIRTSNPTISISYKAGLITLNSAAIELLGLAEGKNIELLQDEERKKDWYIRATDSADGFVLRYRKGSAALNSTPLARTVLRSLGLFTSQRLKIALKSSEDAWAIITANVNPLKGGNNE